MSQEVIAAIIGAAATIVAAIIPISINKKNKKKEKAGNRRIKFWCKHCEKTVNKLNKHLHRCSRHSNLYACPDCHKCKRCAKTPKTPKVHNARGKQKKRGIQATTPPPPGRSPVTIKQGASPRQKKPMPEPRVSPSMPIIKNDSDWD